MPLRRNMRKQNLQEGEVNNMDKHFNMNQHFIFKNENHIAEVSKKVEPSELEKAAMLAYQWMRGETVASVRDVCYELEKALGLDTNGKPL